MQRRAVLAISGLAALAPLNLIGLLTPTTALPLPPRIGPGEISQLSEIADSLQRWDNSYGSGGMVGQVASNAMRWAVGLLSVECPESLRPKFLAAIARLGLVAGACQFDILEHGSAETAFRIAVECAEEGLHWHLRAKGYSLLARQAVWTGQADNGLTYAEKGLVRSDRLTPTEQAMLHTARARAWGKLRNVREALAAVGAADDAFSRRQPGNDPTWMSYYDEAQHNGDTAHALFDLAVEVEGHDAAQAIRRFTAAVRGHSDQYTRSRAISSTKLASLVIATGDPAEGIALGHRAVALSGKLTSRRAAADLKELGRYAERVRTAPGALDLCHKIRATVQV
ncbi:hypothetical protein LN042_09830 [Kitasatospora sp. RB6PN24]|uniref:hypothetical protein n=1 Tax=Kitasatospora humi TaxID=2893891 RepID=UPI001E2B5E4B|nr:hypothetical protein [Kitasatospora humi]MCC9307396.1 hypothetical protein [Kitasatospora humi]